LLRKAKVGDVPAMNWLRLQVRENMLSDPGRITEAMTRQAITAEGRGWIWDEGGSLLGFSIARDADPSIWALFVLPGNEGRGIGSALHDAAVDWLWLRGATRIWLSTDPDTRAARFYRDRGWYETAVLPSGEVRLEIERPSSQN